MIKTNTIDGKVKGMPDVQMGDKRNAWACLHSGQDKRKDW